MFPRGVVADMTDDVPEQPTEAPEMRADAQGADSGEGSDGDDAAEGFPGGPPAKFCKQFITH